jgi:hypothetical protein
MPDNDLTVTAVFDPAPVVGYVLTTAVTPVGSGTLTGGPLSGIIDEGSAISITAVPNAGYKLLRWERSDGVSTTSSDEYSFNMPSKNLTVTAVFGLEVAPKYNLTALPSNKTHGSVTSDVTGAVEAGAGVTLTATANAGYRFVKWTRSDGVKVSETSEMYTFEMPNRIITILAQFEALPGNEYRLSLAADPGVGGDVVGTKPGTYRSGTTITLTAIPSPPKISSSGFKFDGWVRSDGVALPNTLTVSFTMPSRDLSVTAIYSARSFSEHLLEITKEGNGNVSGMPEQSLVYEDASVTLNAYPASGYHFARWESSDGLVVGSDSSFTFLMPGYDITVKAVFEINSAKQYMLVAAPKVYAQGRVVGAALSSQHEPGETITLEAVPNPGYRFDRWERNDKAAVPNSTVYTFDMPAKNLSVIAVFVAE